MRILGNDRSRTRFFTSSVNQVVQPLLRIIARTDVFYPTPDARRPTPDIDHVLGVAGLINPVSSFATRFTGHACNPSSGYAVTSPLIFSVGAASQSDQCSGLMITGIRSCIGVMIALAAVVIMQTVLRMLPSGAFHDSQSPAIAIGLLDFRLK